ncbi:MAG: hypothetical protein V4643_15245 [Bacteroidota bacterium]
MKERIRILIAISFLLIGFTRVKAQQQDTTINSEKRKDSLQEVNVTLKDGTVLKGSIIAISLQELTLRTTFAGTVVLKQEDIASIVNVKNSGVSQPVTTNSNAVNDKNPNNLPIVSFGGSKSNGNYVPYLAQHKYLVSNNYMGLKKKEFIYQNIWVLYNGVDYGLSDNFSIGGGGFFLGVIVFTNIHLRTQFQISEMVKIGAAYNVFFTPNNGFNTNRSSSTGVLSGGITIGTKDLNITTSIGQAKRLGGSSADPINGFSVSGYVKVGNTLALITDNLFINNSDHNNFLSAAFRLSGRNTVFDFGLMGNTYQQTAYEYYGSPTPNERTQEEFVAYPYLSLTYKIK